MALTAFQLYEAVQYKINKFHTATLDVPAFNNWFNAAQTVYVRERYKEYEQTQLLSDSLRTLLVQATEAYNDATTVPVLKAKALPEDYRHLLNAQVEFLVKQALRDFSVADTFFVRAERMTSTLKTLAHDNHYLQPSVDQPFWRVVGSTLEISYDTLQNPNAKVVVKNVYYEYLRKPDTVTLELDLTSTANSTFPEEVDEELTELCANLYLQSIGISLQAAANTKDE